MTEQTTNNLNQLLTQDEAKRGAKKARVDNVRQQLETRARNVIGLYEREVTDFTSLAQEKIEKVIQPWLDNLHSDGTWDRLLGWAHAHRKDLLLSRAFHYFWPEKAIRALQEQRKPFQTTASYILNHYNDIQEGIEKNQAGKDEIWNAFFRIDERNGSQRLLIDRWPTVGGGYAFAAIRSKQLEISIDPKDVAASFHMIHPEVWVLFAEQIENGQTLQALEESLKPRRVRIVSAEQAQAEAFQARQEYLELRRKQGR